MSTSGTDGTEKPGAPARPLRVRRLTLARGQRLRNLLLLIVSLSLLVSCLVFLIGGQPFGDHSSSAAIAPMIPGFAVTFATSVPYTTALEDIVDLGLHPTVACGYQSDVDAGRVISIGSLRWLPAGQRDQFEREHRLYAAITPLAPADWSGRLGTVPGVLRPQLSDVRQALDCLPRSPSGSATAGASGTTLVSNGPAVLTNSQVQDIFARVAFAPGTDYAAALYAVSNLGLRLADPCYEQLRVHLANQGKEPVWHPMGQEASFAASHVLVVAPAPLTSPTTWADQIRSLSGVTGASIPYSVAC